MPYNNNVQQYTRNEWIDNIIWREFKAAGSISQRRVSQTCFFMGHRNSTSQIWKKLVLNITCSPQNSNLAQTRIISRKKELNTTVELVHIEEKKNFTGNCPVPLFMEDLSWILSTDNGANLSISSLTHKHKTWSEERRSQIAEDESVRQRKLFRKWPATPQMISLTSPSQH